jgi:hypothetical protein
MKTIVSLTSALLSIGLLCGEAHASCPFLSCNNVQIVVPIAFYAENLAVSQSSSVQWIQNEVTTAVSGFARTTFTATYSPGGLYDSAVGYDKELLIDYTCDSFFSGFVHIGGEAHNQTTVPMDCTNTGPSVHGTINWLDAYYGYNIDGSNAPDEKFSGDYGPHDPDYGTWGFGTSIFEHCIGFGVCEYFVENKLWAFDPYIGKDKNLVVDYWCTDGTYRSTTVAAEANHRGFILTCN